VIDRPLIPVIGQEMAER